MSDCFGEDPRSFLCSQFRDRTRGSPAREHPGQQSIRNTETSLGKLEFWCQLTHLSALTFYIIWDEDVGSSSAEEGGATTGGDLPATRPNMRIPLASVKCPPLPLTEATQTDVTGALLAQDLVLHQNRWFRRGLTCQSRRSLQPLSAGF